MTRPLFCAAALAALVSGGAHAETLEETAAAFGARQSVLGVSLSPSGNKILYLAPGSDSAEIVYVVDLAGDAQPKAVTAQRGLDSELAQCEWATDSRVICQARYIGSMDGVLIGASRLFALDDDGSNQLSLSAQDSMKALGIRQDGGRILALDLPDRPGRVLMTREWVKENTAGTRLANSDEGLGVVEVDIANGRRRNVEPPAVGNVDFIADDKGQLRIRTRQPLDSRGYMRPDRLYSYRDANSRGWQPLSDTRSASDGEATFFPAAVDASRNVAYGFTTINGYDAVSTIALDGTGRSEVVLSRDDVDVDSLIRIGRQRRVVGASYATEKREIAYFDEELGRLSEQFHKVLPGEPLVEVVGASANERRLLLIGSSDVDPGMVYLFDKDTRELSELLPLRRELTGRAMGQMRPVTFPAADGTMIPGYLTLPPGVSEAGSLPAIVLPHGGPSARDEWGFDWLVQFFAARGYAVLQPNFRGSTGYGSAWFGRNGFQAWRTAIGDVNDAGRWLVSEGIGDPARLAVVGWSYGGYAALQTQVLDNTLYKAVVAIAPVTDLDRFREEKRAYTSFRIVDRFVGQGAHIAEGSPARNAQAFAAPVLMFHGTLDQNVGVAQARLMKSRLEEAGKPVRYVEYAGYDHQLDEGSVRTDMLTHIGRFLEASLAR
jgi:dipeptidyl aminopeptidase/acylaminoacyl peptidase